MGNESQTTSFTDPSKNGSSSFLPKDKLKNMQTYIRIEGEGEEIPLEIDLMYIKSRGVVNQSLDLNLILPPGHANGDPEREVSHFIKSIKTKEEFEQIKKFFSQLEWD